MKTDLYLGFTGARQDPVTSGYLLGNGYRAYLPGLMRFNAPDSFSPFGMGGVNPYTYCAGDPVNRSDPSGHFSLGSFARGVKGAFGRSEDKAILMEDNLSIGAEDMMASARKALPEKKPSAFASAFGNKRVKRAREWYANQTLASAPGRTPWQDLAGESHNYQLHYKITLSADALPKEYTEMSIAGHVTESGGISLFEEPQLLHPGETIVTHAIDSGLRPGNMQPEIKQRLLIHLSSENSAPRGFIMTLGTRHDVDALSRSANSYMDQVRGDSIVGIKTDLDPFQTARYVFPGSDSVRELEFGITGLSF